MEPLGPTIEMCGEYWDQAALCEMSVATQFSWLGDIDCRIFQDLSPFVIYFSLKEQDVRICKMSVQNDNPLSIEMSWKFNRSNSMQSYLSIVIAFII